MPLFAARRTVLSAAAAAAFLVLSAEFNLPIAALSGIMQST